MSSIHRAFAAIPASTLLLRRAAAALAGALALSLAPLGAWAAVEANKASQAELESVKGIGPAMSGKIMAARQGKPFAHWADMVERVAGIGPGNAAKFSAAGLTVAGQAYDGAAAAPKAAPKADAKAAADPRPGKEAVAKDGAASPR